MFEEGLKNQLCKEPKSNLTNFDDAGLRGCMNKNALASVYTALQLRQLQVDLQQLKIQGKPRQFRMILEQLEVVLSKAKIGGQ